MVIQGPGSFDISVITSSWSLLTNGRLNRMKLGYFMMFAVYDNQLVLTKNRREHKM